MVKCKVCNTEFETEKQLHGHLKVHELRMAEYYQKYLPRYDLHDKKIIKSAKTSKNGAEVCCIFLFVHLFIFYAAKNPGRVY